MLIFKKKKKCANFYKRSFTGSFFFFLFLNIDELQFQLYFLIFKNKNYLIRLRIFLTFYKIKTNFQNLFNI